MLRVPVTTRSEHASDETLSPDELGLPAHACLPFRLTAADAWSPLVISLPHVGLAWPHELGPQPPTDFGRNADYAVDSLYGEAARRGAVAIQAEYSRLVVDLNRAADDISASVVPDHPDPRPRRRPGVPVAATVDHDAPPPRPGRGVVWTHALDNVPLHRGPLAYAALCERIARFHEPYHRALEILLARRRARFGYAILLDAHSMPCSVGVDLVVGSLCGRACGAAVERMALDALDAARGPAGEGAPRLSVRLNDPYLGGELVRRFGRPAEGIHALQLEVSRALYMDERTLTLWQLPASHDDTRTTARPPTSASHTGAGERAIDDNGARGRYPKTATPPSARQLADFAELRRRVSCLIRALSEPVAATLLDDPRHRTRTSSGTSCGSSRATATGHPKLRARL